MNKPIQSLSILATTALAAATFAADPQLALPQVEESLRPILAGLTPVPAIEYVAGESSLRATYRPQKFLVHGRSKSGEWSTNTTEQVGPSATGFVLQIHRQPKGEVNQAVTPQTIQQPYWRTDLDVTPVAGTTNQIYWALSYGGRTDGKLREQLKAALRDLGGADAANRVERRR